MNELILHALDVLFPSIHRPSDFTGRDHCDECAGYDDFFSRFDRTSLTVEAVTGDLVDPVSFLSDDGFKYFLPSLARFTLRCEEDNYYLDKFLFQLSRARLLSMTGCQRMAIHDFLCCMRLCHGDVISEMKDSGDLSSKILELQERLE